MSLQFMGCNPLFKGSFKKLLRKASRREITSVLYGFGVWALTIRILEGAGDLVSRLYVEL